MAVDAPDWVTRVQVAVTVENIPVVPEVGTEVGVTEFGNFNAVTEEYTSTAKWTISENKVGELKEILIISDNYAKTLIQVEITGMTTVTDWSPQAAMPLIYEDLKLEAGAEVEVSIKSSDGTIIDVDALIVGKEIG